MGVGSAGHIPTSINSPQRSASHARRNAPTRRGAHNRQARIITSLRNFARSLGSNVSPAADVKLTCSRGAIPSHGGLQSPINIGPAASTRSAQRSHAPTWSPASGHCIRCHGRGGSTGKARPNCSSAGGHQRPTARQRHEDRASRTRHRLPLRLRLTMSDASSPRQPVDRPSKGVSVSRLLTSCRRTTRGNSSVSRAFSRINLAT